MTRWDFITTWGILLVLGLVCFLFFQKGIDYGERRRQIPDEEPLRHINAQQPDGAEADHVSVEALWREAHPTPDERTVQQRMDDSLRAWPIGETRLAPDGGNRITRDGYNSYSTTSLCVMQPEEALWERQQRASEEILR